jgi:hypothetical protein
MALNFENDREAFLGVLSLVVAADQVGSLAERDFLFDRLIKVDLFQGMTKQEVGKLLGRVTENVYDSLSNDGASITPAGIEQLLEAAKSKLGTSQGATLVQVATELSKADDGSAEELALIDQIKQRLGV